MKKLLIYSTVALMFSFVALDNPLTKKERKYATNLLKETEKEVEKTISGLSEAQLTYRPENKWSIEDCLKHIAESEKMLGEVLEKSMKEPANPDKRSDIKASDEEVVRMIEDRSKKSQTMDPLKPENIALANTNDALAAFKLHRAKLKNYVQDTREDMRNHVIDLGFASFDAYQFVLFIAAHSNRHMQQMEEVKASEGYPK